MIEIYLFEYLTAFYEEGSLSKASQKLYVSQPSLSRSMQKLENELGIPLFNRLRNKITFNENGKMVYEYAKNIIEAERVLLEKVKKIKEKNQTVHVGMTAPGVLFRYVDKFLINNDETKYTYEIGKTDNLIKGLEIGKFDIIFINDDIITPFFKKNAFEEQLYLNIPKTHPLSNLKEVSFKDADGQSFLLSNNLGIWDDIVEKHLPNSRFLRQNLQQLGEIIESSTIPAFATNITKEIRNIEGRFLIPFIDKEAKISFIAYSKNKKIIDEF